jgi:ankyrin repeat protein
LNVQVGLGADTGAKNADGATPLHRAAATGHVEAMKAPEAQ